jgi:hypothetical protein
VADILYPPRIRGLEKKWQRVFGCPFWGEGVIWKWIYLESPLGPRACCVNCECALQVDFAQDAPSSSSHIRSIRCTEGVARSRNPFTEDGGTQGAPERVGFARSGSGGLVWGFVKRTGVRRFVLVAPRVLVLVAHNQSPSAPLLPEIYLRSLTSQLGL